MVLVLLILVMVLLYMKFFTMILDSKDSARVNEKTYPYLSDYEDREILIESVDHIFIGEVLEEAGHEWTDDTPHTQFTIRLTQNIKGSILGDITVNQPGGYYKEKGSLKLLKYKGDSLLKPGEMYLFAATVNTESGWYDILPVYGSIKIKTEEQKLLLIEEFTEAMAK
ncbi:MAG TPA: hypothetical protein DCR24_03905 [Bacillus bacterium]|nr:hypothetical protein [Bacillus sp. (in: firmicutes)]